MENVKIAQVCGLCAGCKHAIDTTIKELKSGNSVTMFKEIVHNKNVNNLLASLGAKQEDCLEKLSAEDIIVIRAHGEPPSTYKSLNKRNIQYRDCTCRNVVEIHNIVSEYAKKGFLTIVIGKYKSALHPEVLGTVGWAMDDVVLIEDQEDLDKLRLVKNKKWLLVCQTTFNIAKAEELIAQIENKAKDKACELVVKKTLCMAQKVINQTSANLAKDCDVMIVVGGASSSNSKELFANVSSICPSVFIEDIKTYKDALAKVGIKLNGNEVYIVNYENCEIIWPKGEKNEDGGTVYRLSEILGDN